jgi:Abnormal spindle-like microcephaly-assoc'd, ASPM-SPD-2-Hydin
VRVYAVDLSTGYFNEVSGSPFTAAGFGLPIAFSVAPGSGQPIVGPVATLTPPSLAFGNSNVGTAAPTQSLVLSSTGDQALSVNAIGITGLNAGDFSELDNCNAPTVLKTTTSCLITVTFTPTASGSRLAQFTVTDNAPGSPQSVALSGTGLGAPPPAPAITFTPGTLNFSAVSPGSTSLPLSVTLTNSGNAPLNISAITLSGSNPADFSAPSSNCAAAPIAPGASCIATESFTPLAVGFRQAALVFADNATGSPQSITLTGTEVSTVSGPALTFLPTTVNFPSLSQGSTSSVQTITVTNSGNAPATITAIILGGSNPADFSAPTGTCIGTPLLPNTSCVVNETFTPSAVGVRQAALIFTDNASGNPQSVALIGIGINSSPTGPALKFLPTSVTFPATTQGLASTPITVAITNSGTAPMHISNISAGGNSPADFTNSLTSCSTATVAPNASCTVSVTFSPIFSGPRSETLTVTDDAPNSPHVLNIFASAPPAFSITSPSTALSATVSAGQSASYALQLTPGLDYNGTISFTCTGAAVNATCQAPPSVVLNVGAPAAFTVTVATSGAALVAPEITSRRSPRTPVQPGVTPSAVGLALGMLLFILFLRSNREWGGSAPAIEAHAPHWRIAYAMVALMILLPLLFAADGCGGGSTPAPTAQKSSVVTPSGTSTLVITPTATNASGKALQIPLIQLTLTVN